MQAVVFKKFNLNKKIQSYYNYKIIQYTIQAKSHAQSWTVLKFSVAIVSKYSQIECQLHVALPLHYVSLLLYSTYAQHIDEPTLTTL